MRTITILITALALLGCTAAAASASEVTITQEVGNKPNFPAYAGSESEAGKWLLNEELGETSAYPYTSLGTAKVALGEQGTYTIKSVSVAFALKMYGADRFYNPVKLHVILRQGKHIAGTYGPYLECGSLGCPKKLLAGTQIPEQPPNEQQGQGTSSTVPYATYPLEVVAPTKLLKAKTLYVETFVSGFQAADGTECPRFPSQCAKYFEIKPVATVTLVTQ
jgi:hypothetical protein